MKKINELTVWAIYTLHFGDFSDEFAKEDYAEKYVNVIRKRNSIDIFKMIFNSKFQEEIKDASSKAVSIYKPKWREDKWI